MTPSRLHGALSAAALLLCVVTIACEPPPGPGRTPDTVTADEIERERQLYPGIEKRNVDASGRLQVFTTSLLTDGRNLKVRGKLRNPMPEAVDGVRLIFRIYGGGPGTTAKPLETVQKEKSIRIKAGETTALRWDVQTMYASGQGSFSIEAYAMRIGNRDIPPPPGWRQ
jgi:hypothetical protein